MNPDSVSQKDRRSAVESTLKDYGFYHDLGDVQRMYAEYVNNRLLGYAGGVMDQPDAYWHDMYVMKNLAIWVEEYAPLVGFTDGIPVIDKLKSGGSLL